MMMRVIIFLVAVFFIPFSWADESSEASPVVNYNTVAEQVIALGDQLIASYSPENGETISEGISDLYFDDYEGSGLEKKITMASAGANTLIESHFGALIGQTYKKAAKAEVEHSWGQLKEALVAAKPYYQAQESGFWSVLIQSFLILLREGFEAILVISALAAFVRREQVPGGGRVVAGATLCALAASGVTALLMMTVLDISGPGREAMEGITMLFAVAVLLYVGGWLFSKREADRWQQYIRDRVSGSIAKGSMCALGGAIFLAVYREGAETVLFYQALYSQVWHGQATGQITALWLGILAASAALLVLYWGMTRLSIRLPMKAFFTGTALLIFALAFVFAGNGILELQNAGWVASSVLDDFPRVTALGIHPTFESLSLQGAILLLPLIVAIVVHSRSKVGNEPVGKKRGLERAEIAK